MFLVFAIIAFYSIGGIWIWFYLGFGYSWFSWILKRTVGLFGLLDFDSVFLQPICYTKMHRIERVYKSNCALFSQCCNYQAIRVDTWFYIRRYTMIAIKYAFLQLNGPSMVKMRSLFIINFALILFLNATIYKTSSRH